MPRVRGFQTDEDAVGFEVTGFESHQPGFKLQIDTDNKTKLEHLEMIFGAIGQLMSVAIFEQRNEAISVLTSKGPRLYFAKPFESMCMENLSFMFKHLNEVVFQSGVSALVNQEALHDTFYKSYLIRISNMADELRLKFELSYVT
jgi:hypothetical protein